MSAMGPGDFVECIDSEPRHSSGCAPTLDGLIRGAVYRVKSGPHVHPVHGAPTFCLEGFPSFMEPGAVRLHAGFGVFRFRPIYRPKVDFIEGLLKPTDAPAEPERVQA